MPSVLSKVQEWMRGLGAYNIYYTFSGSYWDLYPRRYCPGHSHLQSTGQGSRGCCFGGNMVLGREYQCLVVLCMTAFTYKATVIISALYHSSGSKHTFHLKHQDILGENDWGVDCLGNCFLLVHHTYAERPSEFLGFDKRCQAISSCHWGSWLHTHTVEKQYSFLVELICISKCWVLFSGFIGFTLPQECTYFQDSCLPVIDTMGGGGNYEFCAKRLGIKS